MKGKAGASAAEKKPIFKVLLKGVVVSLCVAFVLVLLFAFILRFTTISDSIIAPVNEVIKGVSIFLGVFIGMRKVKSNGIISGILIGFFFTIFAFLIFSLLDGHIVFDKTLIFDLIFGTIIGGICGIISVNLKKI